VVVTSVVSLPLPDARGRITDLGLTVGTVTPRTVTNADQDGVVLDQTPAPGTTATKGDSVDLTVGKFESIKVTVAVPNVIEFDLPEARSQITAKGLTVGTITTRTVTNINLDGMVIDQSPRGGTVATKGDPVNLVVGNVVAQTVTVPNVIGSTLADARSQITAKGLTVGTVTTSTTTNPAQDGKVIDQTPNGGVTATKGDPVNLVVGKVEAPQVLT
jgi:serine/threonine-protein kinase